MEQQKETNFEQVVHNGRYVQVTNSAIIGFDHLLQNMKFENGRFERAVTALDVIFNHHLDILSHASIPLDSTGEEIKDYISNAIKLGHLLAIGQSSLSDPEEDGWYEKPIETFETIHSLEVELNPYIPLPLETFATTSNIFKLEASKIRSLPPEMALQEIQKLKPGAEERIILAEQILSKVINEELKVHPSANYFDQIYLARSSVSNALNNLGYLYLDKAYHLKSIDSLEARCAIANSQELFNCALNVLQTEGRHLPKVSRASILPVLNKAYANILFASLCLTDTNPDWKCIANSLESFRENVFTDAYKKITDDEIDCPYVPNLGSFKNELDIRLCQALDFILQINLGFGSFMKLDPCVAEQSRRLLEKIFWVNGMQISSAARFNDNQLNFEVINLTDKLLSNILNEDLDPEDKIEAKRASVSFGKTIRGFGNQLKGMIDFKRKMTPQSAKI